MAKGKIKTRVRDDLWRARIGKSVRPGVEALLLAAVALGFAQAGWAVVTPSNANALSDTSDDVAPRPVLEAQTYTPFAPHTIGGATHAVSALLSSVQLNGVRMSLDASASGAMFTLADGAQRAFLVGREVADGVILQEVQVNYVILSYQGGQRRLDMAAGPSFSFARAMMGLESAPGAPAAASGERFGEIDRAWLAATLRNVEIADGVPRGWRVGEAPPAAVVAAGLRSGDLVTAINGAGPGNMVGALGAARAGEIQLDIDRAGARMTLTLRFDDRT